MPSLVYVILLSPLKTVLGLSPLNYSKPPYTFNVVILFKSSCVASKDSGGVIFLRFEIEFLQIIADLDNVSQSLKKFNPDLTILESELKIDSDVLNQFWCWLNKFQCGQVKATGLLQRIRKMSP